MNSRFKIIGALDCPGLNRAKGTWYNALPPVIGNLGSAFVSLKVYTIHGKAIVELAGKEFGAGNHTIHIGTKVLPEGLCPFSLQVNGNLATRKVVVDAD